MGQKIHPTGFRLAVSRNWASRWYASNTQFAGMLKEDIEVREFLKKKLKNASVGRVVIERPAKNARITIYSSRPGVVIGKKGEDIELLKAELQRRMGVPVHVNIEEIRKPEVDAQLIADSITQQLERRIMFRRAMKRAMQNAMRLGAQGIKIMSSGRLNGIEIARTEWYREGRVPCIRCAPTSTTASPKRKLPTASSVSRCGCTRATTWVATTRPSWKSRKKSVASVRVVRKAVAVRARVARVVSAAVLAQVAAVPAAPTPRLENKHAATEA